jgi:hypothetical protein
VQPVTNPAPAPTPPPGGIKPGWRTTEFWVTLLTICGLVVASGAASLPERYAAIGASVSASLYAIARGLAKLLPPKASA